MGRAACARSDAARQGAIRPAQHAQSGSLCGRHLMAELATHLAKTSAFDAHHPPSREIISDCVHCGFCLPTCPTWVLWREEMDSPRGRINLMKLATDGEIELTPQVRSHF